MFTAWWRFTASHSDWMGYATAVLRRIIIPWGIYVVRDGIDEIFRLDIDMGKTFKNNWSDWFFSKNVQILLPHEGEKYSGNISWPDEILNFNNQSMSR